MEVAQSLPHWSSTDTCPPSTPTPKLRYRVLQAPLPRLFFQCGMVATAIKDILPSVTLSPQHQTIYEGQPTHRQHVSEPAKRPQRGLVQAGLQQVSLNPLLFPRCPQLPAILQRHKPSQADCWPPATTPKMVRYCATSRPAGQSPRPFRPLSAPTVATRSSSTTCRR